MAESAPSDGKQATAPAQGTAPPRQRAPSDAAAHRRRSCGSRTCGDAGKTSDADMREADGNASADAATQETGDANSGSKAPDAGGATSNVNMEGAPKFKTPRHTTLEDVSGLIFAGMLRQEEVDFLNFLVPERPPHWKLPAPPNLKTNAQLVGVPGIVNDIRAGAFAMEGYGGATTLVGFEELSDEDLQGLKEVSFELDHTLNFIGIRREMASLLRHFNSTRLAERVFKMTGYLRRVLEAYRHMISLADSQQGASAVQDTVDTRRKYKELKCSWKFTCDYWLLEVQEPLGKADSAGDQQKTALQEQMVQYQDEIDSLESEKAQLKARLADSEAQVQILKSRLEAAAAVDPWKFSDFLQKHTEFTGNWERFHDLFKFCINVVVKHRTRISNCDDIKRHGGRTIGRDQAAVADQEGLSRDLKRLDNTQARIDDQSRRPKAAEDRRGRIGSAQQLAQVIDRELIADRRSGSIVDQTPIVDRRSWIVDREPIMDRRSTRMGSTWGRSQGKNPPPESWDTVINVTAMDKRKAAVAPYPEKSTRMPPSSGSGSSSRPEILDLTGPGSKSRSGTRHTFEVHKLQGSQRRPKNHQPGRDSVRRAGEKNVVSKEAAHTMLPGGIVWKEVRPDVRQAILAGLRNDTAMEWIGSDRAALGHFRQPQPTQMLVSMMHWRRLDQTPWSKYVPEANYEMADERLDRRLRRGDTPSPWANLDDQVVYPDEDADSTVDDVENDPDYKPPAQDPEEDTSSCSEVEAGKPAAKIQEGVKEEEEEDDEEEVEEPLESKPPVKRPRSGSSGKSQSSNPKPKKQRRKESQKHTSGTQASGATQETKAPTRPKKPFTLARKSYAELTVEDLRTTEVPEDDETSWCIHRILVLYPSSTKSSSCQTPGFPEDEIHKVFYFHERSLLTAKALKLVEEIVDAMHKHAQVIWERGHWVPIPTEATGDTLMESSDNTPGFIPSLLHEPGVWKIPDKCCHWIWEDPTATTQLAALDMREPTRVKWNTAADDGEWLQYVPRNVSRHIKPTAIRKLNLLSLVYS
ncbi:hypothetical protein PHYSODRAFT_337306 [Phytophthora sojae]|uniref:Uncharacterized protein n=1 Tax=Phytophthora sojae (strain P6497) TaxID=1094619 RepID=G5A0A4_PHYSP|nr:hypothetical protein PHYSODRAFT_337306 [Phytophthora sojae]EGZ10493.1 hypothetical protein PHYSODRAFT_337306 [Phytophthora sojae]|eukprot:XP_009533238.1 hypothetical protein PHYSODRAFT_337306 [Phytophthora sojae]